jgi:hypothetical protein
MDIQRKAFEESNNVNPDWSFKFDEELQQYVAVDFEMTNQVDEFNEHWDTFRAGWDAAKAQAVPEAISIGNELQSWVAVNSFSADDGEGVLPVVDANAIAEKIEELTGASQ